MSTLFWVVFLLPFLFAIVLGMYVLYSLYVNDLTEKMRSDILQACVVHNPLDPDSIENAIDLLDLLRETTYEEHYKAVFWRKNPLHLYPLEIVEAYSRYIGDDEPISST